MTKRLVALLGAAVIVLGACSPAATPAGSGSTSSGGPSGSQATGGLAADQILRIYCCAEDPRSLEAQASSGSDEISIEGGMYRGLLYYNQDLSLRPELAQDLPTVSPDGLTYTYKLKDGIKYASGDPIVAGDFVRAAQHLADPRNAFDYGYEMCWLAGSDKLMGSDFCSNTTEPTPDTKDNAKIEELLKGLGAEAPDDKTVIFHLSQPVDASGTLPGGGDFKNIRDFKQLLLKDERQIARNLAKQLLVFGTGAPVRFGDRTDLEQILDRSSASHYAVRTLIEEIVQSDLFLTK